MNSADRENFPPENPHFIVGAKRRPDGTWDHSRAAEWIDTDGKLAKGSKEGRESEIERKRVELAKRLEIPKEVTPGNAQMTWHNLRNTIIMNKEAAKKAQESGKPNKNLETLIDAQEKQATMLDNINMRYSADQIKRGLKSGEIVTAEQADQRAAHLTADEMHGLVQHVIDHYQSLQDEGREDAYLQEGHFDRYYPIKDLLKAAGDLQSKLIDEASRGRKL